VSAVNDDIRAARRYGVVRCGVSSLTAPTVSELDREFGLRPNESCYREIDEATARASVLRPLHRDMAYDAEVMPLGQAGRLTDCFFAQFGEGSTSFSNKFFTNNWCSVTHATFEEGVLILGQDSCGCLWVEDKD
jgi:hypothetical protein